MYNCKFSRNCFFVLILFSFCFKTNAQVVGGESVYQFLRIAPSTHISAMGGSVVCNPSQDVSFAMQNPALLRPTLHSHLSINQNLFFGANITNVMYAYHLVKYNTTVGGGITYVNHGKINATYTNGVTYDNIFAVETALQLSAASEYKNKWRYGLTTKLVSSQLGAQNSIGLMADGGVVYADTAKQIYFGMLAKNIGGQLSKYNTQSGSEPLPFDMQIGISKKFLKAPFKINAILHHLYQWDVNYDNPTDRAQNFFNTTDTVFKKNVPQILLKHLNLSVDLLLGKRIELTVGYNHMRRGELVLKDRLGLGGFSFGAALLLPKINVYFARALYNSGTAYNQFGVNVKMKEMFGIGKSINTSYYY